MSIILLRFFHTLHMLHGLTLCPGKCSLIWFVLKPFHQIFQTGQLLLLALICLLLKPNLFQLFFPVMGIIARIPPQSFSCQLIHNIRGLVQKKTVMGYHYHRVFIMFHILFQPSGCLHIQMVGRLVQEQYIRLFKKQAD